jgi:hypothetical protein
MKSISTQTKTHLQSNANTHLQNLAGTTRFKSFTQSGAKECTQVFVLCLFLLSSAVTFAQIAQRGAATTGFGTSTTLSIAMPSAVVQGDVMIAAIAHIITS